MSRRALMGDSMPPGRRRWPPRRRAAPPRRLGALTAVVIFVLQTLLIPFEKRSRCHIVAIKDDQSCYLDPQERTTRKIGTKIVVEVCQQPSIAPSGGCSGDWVCKVLS